MIFGHHAIEPGSNPTADVHSGEKTRSAPWKIGTTRVPFVLACLLLRDFCDWGLSEFSPEILPFPPALGLVVTIVT